MINTLEKVREFAQAFTPNQCGFRTYNSPTKQIAALRLQLLIEEVGELAHGLAKDDPMEILDALSDIQYVLDGAYLAFGLDRFKEAAFMEVHRSNMSKLGSDGKPIINGAGRVVKSQHYREPNLPKVVNDILLNGLTGETING